MATDDKNRMLLAGHILELNPDTGHVLIMHRAPGTEHEYVPPDRLPHRVVLARAELPEVLQFIAAAIGATVEIPVSAFRRDRPVKIAMVEVPIAEIEKMPHDQPVLVATFTFACPSCHAPAGAWCRDDDGDEVPVACMQRVAVAQQHATAGACALDRPEDAGAGKREWRFSKSWATALEARVAEWAVCQDRLLELERRMKTQYEHVTNGVNKANDEIGHLRRDAPRPEQIGALQSNCAGLDKRVSDIEQRQRAAGEAAVAPPTAIPSGLGEVLRRVAGRLDALEESQQGLATALASGTELQGSLQVALDDLVTKMATVSGVETTVEDAIHEVSTYLKTYVDDAIRKHAGAMHEAIRRNVANAAALILQQVRPPGMISRVLDALRPPAPPVATQAMSGTTPDAAGRNGAAAARARVGS